MQTTPIQGQHANALTLWVPVKQGAVDQFLVRQLLHYVAKGSLINDDPGHFLHFARFAGIPNIDGEGVMGILLLTDFDQPMTPYLNYFYKHFLLRFAFALLYVVAVDTPEFPETQAVFEQFLNAHNLSPVNSISFAYNASVAQIMAAFPPEQDGSHPNPLTLWIPVKQDDATQEKVKALLAPLMIGRLITNAANLVHYARAVGVPNQTGGNLGVLIIAEFDGPIEPFLAHFYKQPEIKQAFDEIYNIALTPPQAPNSAENFEQYVMANNLAEITSISYAYRATAAEIVTRFPPTA